MLGMLGIAFGLMGIFLWGLVFVPIGVLCTLLCFLKGDIAMGLVSLAVNIMAIIVSPSIWVVLVGIIGLNA